MRKHSIQSFAVALALLGGIAHAGDTLFLPPVDALAVDAETGTPAAGVRIEILAGKDKSLNSIATIQTDADGKATLPIQTLGEAKNMRLSVAWDVPGYPTRTIIADAKLKKGSKTSGGKLVRPDKVKAAYVIDGQTGGDCSNVLNVRGDDSMLEVTFRRPGSYLTCDDAQFKFTDLEAIGSRKINKGKVNFFSLGDDAQMGQSFYNELGASPENPPLKDPMVQAYAQNLIDRIGKASDMPDLKFTVQVIDADVLNAFALPGGYVWVYRGLIEASENESELVGVLAHEVAHVTSRHGTEGMTSAIAKVVGATILGGIAADQLGGNDELVEGLISGLVMTGTQFWILGGTRKREAEADHLGATYAWRAGYDPRGLGDFFKTLSASRNGKQTRMEQFFSDHPNDDERVKANSRDTGYFLPPKSDLIVSSPEYLAVKARLKGMAPAQASGAIAADALFSSFKAANQRLMVKEVQAYFNSDTKPEVEEGATDEEE